MTCAESMRVQAHFDGEVDALTAADIERHVEQCAECRAMLEDMEKLRAGIRTGLARPQAPAELRARIQRALDEQEPGEASARALSAVRGRPLSGARPFWMGAFSGLAAAGAAAIAIVMLSPPPAAPLLDDLVSAHVRSLMPSHLIDVQSTDRHTVKPWFAGHADVSPAVADFADQGFPLVGGRADYVDHQRSAVVVYQHGPHVINVFTWSGGRNAEPRDTARNGYHLVFWSEGNLNYCAVSDAGWDELRQLERLLRNLQQ
jgi:anti-sigma factor RsiW